MLVRFAVKQPATERPRLVDRAKQRDRIEKPTGVVVGFVVKQKSFDFASETFERTALFDLWFAFRVTQRHFDD